MHSHNSFIRSHSLTGFGIMMWQARASRRRRPRATRGRCSWYLASVGVARPARLASSRSEHCRDLRPARGSVPHRARTRPRSRSPSPVSGSRPARRPTTLASLLVRRVEPLALGATLCARRRHARGAAAVGALARRLCRNAGSRCW